MAMNIQQIPFMCDEDEQIFSDANNTFVSDDLVGSSDALYRADVPLLASNVAYMESREDRFDYRTANANSPLLQPIALSEPNRFWQIVVCAFCCSAVSASYTFNLYSGRLQSKYNFTQNDITTITTISDVVGGLTLPFGALYDYYGAWCTFFSALLTLPLGFFLLGLAFSDVIEGSIATFAVYGSIQSIGSSLLEMSAVMTMLSVFPADRGAVVAVMKTFSGMGSAIFGAIHLAFFEEDTDANASRYFYFLTVCSAFASFLAVLFVHIPPYIICGHESKTLTKEQKKARLRTKVAYLRQRAPMSRFAVGFAIVFFLLIYLPIQGALSAYLTLSSTYHIVFALIAVGAFACYPIMALPLKFFEQREYDKAKNDENPEGDVLENNGRTSRISRISRKLAGTTRAISEIRAIRATQSVLLDQANRASSRDSISTALLEELDYTAPQYQTTLLENLATVRMWALIWTLFSLYGSNIVILGNSRFVLSALSGKLLDNSFMALIVVLLGVGSGVGRIVLSIIETVTQNRPVEERIPITAVLLLPVLLTFTSVLLLLFLPSSALPLPIVLIALGNGSTAAGVVIVVRTIYAKDIGKLFNVFMLSVPISSVLMNRFLYAEWYTREAAKQGGTICLGENCVIMPLLVCLVMLFTAFLSTFYLHWEYSKFCNTMLERKKQRLNKRKEEKNNSSNSVDNLILPSAHTVSKEDITNV